MYQKTLVFVAPFLIIFSGIAQTSVVNHVAMIFPGENWEERKPEEVAVDAVKLNSSLDTLKKYCGADGIEEVVIIRNGYLIFKGDSCQKVHGIWSSTKSFTSTVLGLLKDRGIVSVDTYAADIDGELKNLYPNVQLKHFATHTSGYDAKGCNRWCNCCDDDWSPTMLDIGKPLFLPGARFLYYDEAMEMFAKVLTMAAGESLESYIKRNLLDFIGLRQFNWHAEYETDSGIPVCRGGSDIETSALDLARFGHLYLNKGVWNGSQLLNEEWVQMATTNQVPPNIIHEKDHRSGTDGRGIYGYNFWVRGDSIKDNRGMPDTPAGTFYTSGYNNNMCFIIPEWNMVFVRMGLDGNPAEGKRYVYNIFFRELAKALH